LETLVFDPKPPVFASITVYFDPKIGFFDPNLFLNFFCKIFANSKITSFYEKFPNLKNLTFKKLAKNEKFGKIRLSQGLIFCPLQCPLIRRPV